MGKKKPDTIVEAICAQCGERFMVFRYLLEKNPHKCCSISCARRADHAQRKVETADPTCLHCGAPFVRHSNKPKQRYCSVPCGRAGRWLRERGEAKTATCVACGVEFVVRPSNTEKQYCSVACLPSNSPAALDRIAKLSDVEAAYLAGIIDGEGSISTHFGQGNREYNPRHGSYGRLAPKISCVNTDPAMIQWIAERCSGNVLIREYDPATNRRTTYHWGLTGARANALIRRLLPYMVTKRERAAIAIEIYAVLLSYRAPNSFYLLPDAIVPRIEGLALRLSELNARGVTAALSDEAAQHT